MRQALNNKKLIIYAAIGLSIFAIVITFAIIFWHSVGTPEKAFLGNEEARHESLAKKDILGNWYAWHDAEEKEVLTFNENDTYQSTYIFFDEVRDKYRLEQNTVYFDGLAVFLSLTWEQQGGEFVLKADNGVVYYREEEAAQAEIAEKTSETENGWIAEVERNEEKDKEKKEEEVARKLKGLWNGEFGDTLVFSSSDYTVISATRKMVSGQYSVTSPTTMILIDSETQVEELIEFTLTEESGDKRIFASKYFEWAGEFVFEPIFF
ncbi:MAG: hypothetical protein FWF88_05125 [Peptococcaceae bacterium]|nr:hypothetical protein [Peptococcaceae bacterium]